LLLTANFNAERSIRIQDELGNGFSTLSLHQLKKRLRKLGHRFPNARAKYIHEARRHKRNVEKICCKPLKTSSNCAVVGR